MVIKMNELLTLLYKDVKSTFYSARTFQAGIARAKKGAWHRLSSKVSARLRKITH